VTAFAAGITDADAFDPPDNMLANYVFSFTIDAAPSVTAVTPTNTSTGIATNTNLSVTFSEPVTITNSSVTISCANTGAHTVSVSGGPTTWTVDPTSDFGNGELCTATVLAAQVSDNDSNDPPDNMLANFVWSFTTDNPPSVSATTPTNASTTSPDTNVSVTFDEAVNASGSSFTISCNTSGAHTFALSGGPTTFTLDPTTDFTAGETCTVTVVAAQVTDADAGDPPDNMVSDYVFTFSIDAAPTVVSTTPTNGSIDNPTNVAIVINYSEPVTAGGTAYTITCPSTRAFTLGGNGTATHTLTPTINLPPGATCTVNILAAQITDTDTNDPPDNMAANYSFSFSLDQAPFITATSPNDGATGIATNTNIQITWNESVTLSSAGISCATSGSHTSVITGNPGSVSTINPDTDFVPNELCTVTILNTAVSDTDTNDPPDNMGPTYSFQFTTDAAPSVTAVTPTDTSTGIATNTNLSITFSEPVTITNSSVTVSCANTGAHTVTVSGGPTTWTVDPTSDFGNGELCTATVLAAQVSDNDAGDPPDNMAANFVWSFTTDTPPSVTATTPTNASVSIPATNITVTFSEPVNAGGSSFTISCTSSGTHSYNLSGGPTTWTLNPDSDFTEGETCTVTVVAAQVTDTDAGDPPDNMVSDYVFTFSIDSAPFVVTTVPANSLSPDQASNVNIVITYSEPVTAGGTAYTLSCTPSNTSRPFVLSGNGTAVHTLDPNTNLPAGQNCTVSILASQITDVDTNDPPDNMAANYSFTFHVDANPQIVSTSPVDGSTISTNTNIGITWTEPVTMTTVQINCTVSGSHTSVLSTSDNITWTVNPNTDFTAGESCTITVFSATVTDNDTADPPDNPGPDISWTYTVDTAPTVTSTTPTDLATQQANNANITVNFSESVAATTSSFTISCATSGAHTYTLSSSPSASFTLDPNTDFTNGEQCTVTVVAAQIADNDAFDPPDNLAANYVFTFTVDTPPSVTTTTPVNGATGVTPSSTITVNFNESVNATTSSFTVDCGGAQTYTLSSSPSTSFTLTPTSNLPAVLCTVTVIANQISDADAGDPPDNMLANYVFSFTVNTPPTAVDDVDNAIGNLTLTVPDNDGVLVNGADGSGADTDPDPGATITVQSLGPLTGSQGGTITFTPGGGFTYHSEAGDQNVDDVFVYTIVDNNGATDTGQLTIHVGPRYLFVDANFAGAPKDGRDTNPFQTLQQAQTGSAVNDTFVVKQGAYTDFITLKNGQVMYGNGASAALTTTFNTESFTIFTPTGTHPTFKRSTAGDTITLASGNTLRGIDVSASSGGAAITGTNFGTLTVSETRIGVGQTNPNPALVLTNGTLAATFQAVNSTAGLNGISCTTCAGNLTIGPGGTLSGATGDEFVVTGATPTMNVTYSGSITYAGANSAIHFATTAGTYNGNVTFDTGALNVTGGTAINVSATAAGSTGTHNYYVSSGTATINGAVTGINLGANADGTYNFGPAATPANFAITNTTGTSFLISGNAAKATYRGNITQGNAQTMVGITNHAAAGTATFSVGTLNSTAGTGVSLSNADGTENFSGTATLNGATGISITNGTGGTVNFSSGTSITAAGAPFVLDGTVTAVTGVITYSGTINRTNGNGTLLNINTLSTPGSLTFNGTTLTGSTNAAPGWVVSIQNITGTLTTNHLNISNSSGSFGGTMVSIGGTNTAGTMNFHHMILSAAAGSTGSGMVATAASGGTLNITATGGNSSIATANGVGLSLNGQAITNGSILNSLTVTGGAGTVNGLTMTNVTGGTFTITGGSLAGATGATFNVSGGSVSVTYGGTITQANNAAAISVAGGHSGTLTFNGNVSATNGTGLQFNDADGTYNLHGTTTTMNGGNAGVDIIGGSTGTFDFNSGTSISNPSGAAFVVTASGPSITYAGTITQNTASQRAIDITTLAGGTSTFSGAIGSNGGNGVSIEGTAGTVNISGQLTLIGTASVFKACSGTCAAPSGTGLTITASNANNTVGTGTAATTTGVTINRGQIGAAGVQFDTVNVTGGTNGILLSNTGNTAGFTINGTGSSDSGGTLSAQTGDAISITSVRSVTLNEMQISNAGDNAIDATTVTNGLTIDSCDIATTAGSGIKGNTITDFKYQNSSTMTGAGNAANEYGIELTDMFGANNVVSSSSVTGSAVINLFVTNNNSTPGTLNITNSTLNNTAAATGGDGVSIVGNNSAVMTVSLSGTNNLNTNQGDGIQVSANNSSNVTITVNGASSNYNQNLGSAVNIAAANSATITASVSGFTGVSTGTSSANGLNVINIQNFDTSTINAKVFSNTITGLGNNAAGIRLIQEGNGTITADVHNNSISGMAAEGIRAQARAGTGGSGVLNLTLGTANTVNDASGFPLDGVSIESGSSAGGDTNKICLNMFSNTSSASGEQGYRLRQRTGTTFNLQNFGTSPCGSNGASTTDVTCWVNTTKSNTGTTDIVIGSAFSLAPSNCPTPP
jgi:methionine-rich copper-binding protein CopC